MRLPAVDHPYASHLLVAHKVRLIHLLVQHVVPEHPVHPVGGAAVVIVGTQW